MAADPELVALYDAFYASDDDAPFAFVVKAVDACQGFPSWDDRATFVAAQTVGANGKPRWIPSGETLRHVYSKAKAVS